MEDHTRLPYLWKVTRGKRFTKFMNFSSVRNFYPGTFCLLANQQYTVESQNVSPRMQDRCYLRKISPTQVANLEAIGK